LKDNYTNDLNEWFNTKCDLMAWDGEDSKERLRGTKQGWRASDGLALEEPILGAEGSTCILLRYQSNYDGHIKVDGWIVEVT
jgi:hypothetical protein